MCYYSLADGSVIGLFIIRLIPWCPLLCTTPQMSDFCFPCSFVYWLLISFRDPDALAEHQRRKVKISIFLSGRDSPSWCEHPWRPSVPEIWQQHLFHCPSGYRNDSSFQLWLNSGWQTMTYLVCHVFYRLYNQFPMLYTLY